MGRTAASRGYLVVIAAAVFAMLVVQIALARSAESASGPQATASGSVKQQVKKLKQRVAQLEQQVPQPQSPTGAAGGDLTGTYPNPTVAANAIGSSEVAPDSLLGGNIQESSLLQVPSAANSSTVDGVSARSFEYSGSATPSGSVNVLMSVLSGLTLTADCLDGDPTAGVDPDVQVLADSSFNDSYLHSVVTTTTDTVDTPVLDTDFDAADPVVDVTPAEGTGVGTVVYRRNAPAGATAEDATTATFAYHEIGTICQVAGTGLGGADTN